MRVLDVRTGIEREMSERYARLLTRINPARYSTRQLVAEPAVPVAPVVREKRKYVRKAKDPSCSDS